MIGDYMKKTKGKRFADKSAQRKKEDKKNAINKNSTSTEMKKNQILQQNLHEKNTSTKKNQNILFNLTIFICLIVIAFSLYKIVLWFIENNNNNSLLKDVQSSTLITHEEVIINNQPIEKANYDFTELLKQNAQTVGWVYVPNTNIDYPVVQFSDNEYYLNHSFNNSDNSAGWIFADYSCDVKNSKNVIIYGHNRKDWSMFGSLKSVLQDDWRNNAINNYITFSDLDESGIYKIFSVFICNDDSVDSYLENDFYSDAKFKAYMEKIKNTSIYNFDTDIENVDKIITLYTCYGLNNQRLLVFAAKVY